MNQDVRKLLIVEDDPGLQSQLRWCFDKYEVLSAEDRSSALAQVRRHEPTVVLQDLGLPPDPAGVDEGLAAVADILELAPHTKIIVITGNGDRESAVKAVGLGAYDFYQKPIDTDILALIVQRAYQMHELEEENRRLLQQQGNSPLEGIIATSDRMLQICRLIEKVAPTDASVLLLGESGTGKELFARAIHILSPRASGRFVTINCAAIPETLLESELFGYEKGAFTGAVKQTRGKIEHADHGTLFLDEVGDMPLALQAKLLRFLQQRVIERVGGHEEIPVDVRVVCATNQDLSTLIEEGRFREDLYYRISEVNVKVPPLRERDGDVIVLARTFLDKHANQHHRSLRGFSQDALRAIQTHPWPGNVRELENKINGAVILAEGTHVTAKDLELETQAQEQAMPLNLRQVREQAERQAIGRALSMDNGNISKAAELLGISRPTLYDLLNKYGIKANGKRY
jgi:two-component system NtrC family response regulator